MEKLIFNWLKKNSNCVYFNAKDCLKFNASKIFDDCLISSSMTISNVVPHFCYIFFKVNDKISYKKIEPNENNKHNFYDEFIANIKDAIFRYQYIEQLLQIMNDKFSFISADMLINVYECYKFLNNQFKFSTQITSVDDEYINILFDSFKKGHIDNISQLDEFLTKINEYKQLDELLIFFPFKYDHNILNDEFYLFEINNIKYNRKNTDLKKLTTDFYNEYHLNRENYTLDDLFGNNYKYKFSYFDPIIHFKKYQLQYKSFKELLELKHLNFDNFLYDLFDILNDIQFDVVKFQHENLIGSLNTFRSNERLSLSSKELIENLKLELYNHPYKKLNSDYFAILNFIIEKILHQIDSGLEFTKKSTPKDFGFLKIDKKPFNEHLKQHLEYQNLLYTEAEKIFDYLKEIRNSDNKSDLEFILNESKITINIFLEKYSLSNKNKQTIHDMILDLILFYDDPKYSLKKPYNNTLLVNFKEYVKKNSVFSVCKKRNIENIIQEHKLTNFVLESIKNQY